MCRAHRVLICVAVAAWVCEFALLFGTNPGPSSPLRIPSILLGTFAAVLIPYCLFPWLTKSMLEQQREALEQSLHDYHGAFLAGWEAAKVPEPEEPRHLSVV